MCFINTVRPEAGLKVCCEPTSALEVHPWMAPEKAVWGPSKRVSMRQALSLLASHSQSSVLLPCDRCKEKSETRP